MRNINKISISTTTRCLAPAENQMTFQWKKIQRKIIEIWLQIVSSLLHCLSSTSGQRCSQKHFLYRWPLNSVYYFHAKNRERKKLPHERRSCQQHDSQIHTFIVMQNSPKHFLNLFDVIFHSFFFFFVEMNQKYK